MTTKSRPPCEGVGRNDYEKSIESDDVVALHVRAWVEIFWVCGCKPGQGVALHVRAWVEIPRVCCPGHRKSRRPPCEGVGRNHGVLVAWAALLQVALHVRAWVEISKVMDNKSRIGCRPPCEGVGRNDLRC